MKSQKQIETKVLTRINKQREIDGLPSVTMAQYTAARRNKEIIDEYRAALVADAMAQADKDLGEDK